MIHECRRRTSFPALVLVVSTIAVPATADSAEPIPGGPGAEIADTLLASPADASPPRRGIAGTLGHAATVFGSDAWHVVSSPARMDRRAALWVGGTLAVSGLLFAYDEEVLEASTRNRDDPVYDAVIKVGETFEPFGFMGRTNAYYIGAAGLGYALGIEPLKEIPVQLLESHLISGGLRNAARIVIGRRRPFEGRGSRAFDLNGGTSFPSGHASVIFELATILSHHARLWPVTVVAYGLAGTVAVQRVESDAHWPSDVLIAAVSGTAIARTVIRLHEQRKLQLVPAVSRIGGGIGLKATYGF